MKKIVLLLSAMSVLAGIFPARAQHIPQFSQYMFNGLYINPAYAGYKDNLYAHLMYRNQWVGIDGAPKTIMMSVDSKIIGGSNLGLIYANDQLGAVVTNSIMLSYAYRFNVSEKARLSFGVSGGAIHYGMDRSKLDADPLTDQTEGAWRPGVDAGVYFDMKNFYAGLSVMGIIANRADANTLQLMRDDPNFFLAFGGRVPLSEKVSLMPSMLVKSDFKSPMGVDLNAMLMIVERFWVGGSYRTGVTWFEKAFKETKQYDAISIIAEAFITDRIRLGVAYDFDLNNLTTSYNGSFEISLGYYLTSPKRKYTTPRYF
jgi:type IX secretion system PorP/SprF family membrane protein